MTPFASVVIGFIRFYRFVISPLLGPNCRYSPTCSRYALDAVRLHGGLKGGWLAIRRIAKCHPWGGAGYDPVPGADNQAVVPPEKEKNTVEETKIR